MILRDFNIGKSYIFLGFAGTSGYGPVMNDISKNEMPEDASKSPNQNEYGADSIKVLKGLDAVRIIWCLRYRITRSTKPSPAIAT